MRLSLKQVLIWTSIFSIFFNSTSNAFTQNSSLKKNQTNKIRFICESGRTLLKEPGILPLPIIVWGKKLKISGTNLPELCKSFSSNLQDAFDKGELVYLVGVKRGNRGYVCASKNQGRCNRTLFPTREGDDPRDIAKLLVEAFVRERNSLYYSALVEHRNINSVSYNIKELLFPSKTSNQLTNNPTLCPVKPQFYSLSSPNDRGRVIVDVKQDFIEPRLKQLTVRVNVHDTQGSGVLLSRISRKENIYIYCVLTVKHVIEAGLRGDKVEISVFNDSWLKEYKNYPARNIRVAAGSADLAVLEFESERYYPTAVITDSNQLPQLAQYGIQTSLVTGYPKSNPDLTSEPIPKVVKGKFERLLPRPAADGYDMIYSNLEVEQVKEGMSGGPIFNNAGELIGIFGKADPKLSGFSGGISIRSILNYSSDLNLSLRE